MQNYVPFKIVIILKLFLSIINNQAQSEYKHVLANILRSLFVARTPPVQSPHSRLPK